MKFPSVEYDEDNDLLYVQFSEATVDHTDALDDLRMVDYSKDDSVIGIEFISPREGLDVCNIPQGALVVQAIRAKGLSFPLIGLETLSAS